MSGPPRANDLTVPLRLGRPGAVVRSCAPPASIPVVLTRQALAEARRARLEAAPERTMPMTLEVLPADRLLEPREVRGTEAPVARLRNLRRPARPQVA